MNLLKITGSATGIIEIVEEVPYVTFIILLLFAIFFFIKWQLTSKKLRDLKKGRK